MTQRRRGVAKGKNDETTSREQERRLEYGFQ
jgi:hypothetical protein